jgi:hypothetical protein
LITKVPDSHLVLYSFDPADADPQSFGRFCQVASHYLADAGIDISRLIVSNEKFPSIADVVPLLGVMDIFLDPSPRGSEEGALLAIEAGLPVVLSNGSIFSSRPAAVLTQAGLGSLIASEPNAYIAAALRLASDVAWRAEVQQKIQTVFCSQEQVFDPVAAGVAFGQLIETAFDQAYALGQKEFRSQKAPLAVAVMADVEQVVQEASLLLDAGLVDQAAARSREVLASCAGNPAARLLYHRVLLAQQQWQQVAEGLLATVSRVRDRADLWFMLSQAFQGDGRYQDALKALEVSLRIDRNNCDAWAMLSQIAVQSGDGDLQKDIAAIMEQLGSPNGTAIDSPASG